MSPRHQRCHLRHHHFLELIFRSASDSPGSLALIGQGDWATVGEIVDLSCRLAAHFQSHGLQAGDVVGVDRVTDKNSLITTLAVAVAGAESAEMPNFSHGLLQLAPETTADIAWVVGHTQNAHLPDAQLLPEPADLSALDNAVVPKAWPNVQTGFRRFLVLNSAGFYTYHRLSFRQFHERLNNLSRTLKPADRVLIDHDSDYHSVCAILAALSSGGAWLLAGKQTLDSTVMKMGATHVVIGPERAWERCKGIRTQIGASHHLREVFLHADTPMPLLTHRLRSALGHEVTFVFDLPQSGIVSIAAGKDTARYPSSAGVPIHPSRCLLLDDFGQPVETGMDGWLALRLNRLESDAWAANGRAAGECLADGTYRPGIRARLDHDGRLWLVGRGDLLTAVGGQWVNAGLVLQALHIHPWVTRARVIATRGEPNKRKQKLTVAVAGRDDHDVDLQSHCRRTLGQTIPLQVIKTDRRAIPRGLSIT